MDDVEVIITDNIKDAVEEMRGQTFSGSDPELARIAHQIWMENNGLEKLPLGTPVYYLLGSRRDEVARQLGVVDYLLKPVTQDEISQLSILWMMKSRVYCWLMMKLNYFNSFARMLSAERPECKILQAFDGQTST